MDPFNFVDTVFSSQKLVQVEDSQGFSAPRPHKRRPHPVQKADGGEGGVGTIPHWEPSAGGQPWDQLPSQPALC